MECARFCVLQTKFLNFVQIVTEIFGVMIFAQFPEKPWNDRRQIYPPESVEKQTMGGTVEKQTMGGTVAEKISGIKPKNVTPALMIE